MKKRLFCLAALSVFTHSAFAAKPQMPGFASAEHLTSGDSVKLHFVPNDSGTKALPLPLLSGLSLTYGEILTLGDFFGTPEKAISEATTEKEREMLFTAAFGSFAISTKWKTETIELLKVIHHEEKIVTDAANNGQSTEAVYEKISGDLNRQYNCITGGGCSPDNWWMTPGRYLDLAKTDYDHFNHNAWIAYETGHRLAMREAAKAHDTNDLARLKTAYAMDAFASHFLSDHFAAGHLRTPRKELPANTTPSVTGNLLVNYMHNEENAFGLHVHNLRGDRWIAFGDRSYLSQKNQQNREFLMEALQLSADEVFAAFTTGEALTSSAVYNILPIADESIDNANLDPSPLFYWDEKNSVLLRRENMKDYYDRHWTASWWGWSTLLELQQDRGLPALAPSQLASYGQTAKAMELGILPTK